MSVIVRTNFCSNPSFETSLAGTTAQGSHPPTLTQVSLAWPGAGSKAMKVAWQSTVGLFDGAQLPSFTPSAGNTYTITAWVFVPTGSPRVFIEIAGYFVGVQTSVFNQWQRVKYTFTAASSTSHIPVISAPGPTMSWGSGKYCYVDAVLYEQQNAALAYFDGDSVGASWNGTAELSASTFTAFNTDPSLPLTVIEFDATSPQATDFILDVTPLDSAGALIATPRYVNVANQGEVVNSLVIQRGRTDPNGDIQPGYATLGCDNFTGSFDPENLQGPFTSPGNRSYLVKGMLGRISALFDSGGVYTAATIFTGRLENVSLRKELAPDATITFTDDLSIYGTTAMTSYQNSVRSQETTASRAQWLSGLGGLPGIVPTPIISTNLGREMVPTYGGGQVFDEFVDLVAAEAGRVFVDRLGVLNVTAHADDFVNPSVATLSDNVAVPGIEYSDITTSSGTMQISNAVRVRRYGQDSNYPDISAANLSSIAIYGQIQVNGTVGWKAPLFHDEDVLALANYLASRRAAPTPRVDAITIDFAANADAGALLQAEIGLQVVISRTVPYILNPQTLNMQLNIEGLQWNMTPDSFTLTLTTSSSDIGSLFGGAGVFILDSSLLDGADVLSAF